MDRLTTALAAALNWAEQARLHFDWKEALLAFDAAASLRTAGLEKNHQRGDRELWLRAFQGLTSVAAEAHVKLGDLDRAEAVLDGNQALLMRPVDERATHIDTAPLFDEICFLAAGRTGGFALRRVNGSTSYISLPQLTETATNEWAQEPWSACARMGEFVIEKMLEQAPIGRRLLLVPLGQLAVLPWAAASIDGRPLLETTRIHVLPSTAFVRPDVREGIEEVLFVRHDKAFGEGELKHANAEVEWARVLVPRHTYLPNELATRERVLSSISGRQLIHISGHAASNLMSPMDSSTFLADGSKLTLRDVYELDIR